MRRKAPRIETRPAYCPLCKKTWWRNYYGRLVFSNEKEPPTCPNHKGEPVELVFA